MAYADAVHAFCKVSCGFLYVAEATEYIMPANLQSGNNQSISNYSPYNNQISELLSFTALVGAH